MFPRDIFLYEIAPFIPYDDLYLLREDEYWKVIFDRETTARFQTFEPYLLCFQLDNPDFFRYLLSLDKEQNIQILLHEMITRRIHQQRMTEITIPKIPIRCLEEYLISDISKVNSLERVSAFFSTLYECREDLSYILLRSHQLFSHLSIISARVSLMNIFYTWEEMVDYCLSTIKLFINPWNGDLWEEGIPKVLMKIFDDTILLLGYLPVRRRDSHEFWNTISKSRRWLCLAERRDYFGKYERLVGD